MHPKTAELLHRYTRLNREIEHALMSSAMYLALANDELGRDALRDALIATNGHLAAAYESLSSVGLAEILD